MLSFLYIIFSYSTAVHDHDSIDIDDANQNTITIHHNCSTNITNGKILLLYQLGKYKIVKNISWSVYALRQLFLLSPL